jgi:hypothetical protein
MLNVIIGYFYRMKPLVNHNFISLISLLLVVALLSPSLVKLSHALNEHEHFECKSIGQLHAHEVELDCDFQKFNVSPQLYPSLTKALQLFKTPQYKKYFSEYTFLSKYQKLHFALRGPPQVS